MTKDIVKTLKIICTVYIGALLLSWCIQYFFPTADKANLYQNEQIIEVDSREVNYSYYSIGSAYFEKTIILIPDLFGGPEFLVPLGRSLHVCLNVIIP